MPRLHGIRAHASLHSASVGISSDAVPGAVSCNSLRTPACGIILPPALKALPPLPVRLPHLRSGLLSEPSTASGHTEPVPYDVASEPPPPPRGAPLCIFRKLQKEGGRSLP